MLWQIGALTVALAWYARDVYRLAAWHLRDEWAALDRE